MKKTKKVKSQTPKIFIGPSSIGVMPLADRVLVKPLSVEDMHKTTSFGIIIPDTAKEKPEQGVVVAIGPGKRAEKGEILPMSIKVGDKVMFSKYGFDEVKINGTEYYIVNESSVLAILK